jgi:hypothetical protein
MFVPIEKPAGPNPEKLNRAGRFPPCPFEIEDPGPVNALSSTEESPGEMSIVSKPLTVSTRGLIVGL